MMHLLLILAPLAQTVPTRPAAPDGLQAPAAQAAPAEAEPAQADSQQGRELVDPEALQDLIEALDGEAEGAVPEPEPEPAVPEPWHAPESDAARQSQLGPWPDDFHPQALRLEMLPTVDPVTGRILDAGTPMEGELQGPVAPLPAPPEVLPVVAAPLPQDPASEVAVPESEPVLPPPPTSGAGPQPLVFQETGPAIELWPFEPPKGGQSLSRSLMWFFIATVAVFLGRRLSSARMTLPKRGLLPAAALVLKVVSRIAALVAMLFGAMRLVPDAYFQYFPVVLVAASVAVGWSARDVLHDVLAGILLVVEQRLVHDMRVEADGRVGTVIGVGFRSVTMESDDGQIISIPNRDFLSTDTRVDKDPYAPVEVVVEAPHGARRRLEEIALASPLVAPGHPPEVFRDPEHPERWVVRARLVHPRWALAFRGAVQDRLEAG